MYIFELIASIVSSLGCIFSCTDIVSKACSHSSTSRECHLIGAWSLPLPLTFSASETWPWSNISECSSEWFWKQHGYSRNHNTVVTTYKSYSLGICLDHRGEAKIIHFYYLGGFVCFSTCPYLRVSYFMSITILNQKKFFPLYLYVINIIYAL